MPAKQIIKFCNTLIISLICPIVIADNLTQILAPGYGPLSFTAPAAGSYQLPPIGTAANGQVVTADNEEIELYDLMGDKIVLLSFIYSTCSDVNGCPLATAVFHKIKKRLKNEPQIARQLRLITLSFNPEHDTPEIMKQYSQGFGGDSLDWQFLTTRNEQALQPILKQYQQSIQKVYDPQGNFTGTFSHILRVYLIDKNKKLRNIYSVSFLHPDTLINDIKTLLSTSTQSFKKLPAVKNRTAKESNHKPVLTGQSNNAIDLMQLIEQPPLGLPTVPMPDNNPVTAAKIRLGKKLFYDRRLSINNTFSCAMCHIPDQGFSSNEMSTAVGVEGRTVRRNTPTLYNVAYFRSLFHDGREFSLENQVWGPLLAHNEMANPSIGYVIDKINKTKEYDSLFKEAFNRPVDIETIGFALASYQRALNSANSAFDRWYFGKQKRAMSKKAQLGYQLFTGKAACQNCHTIQDKYALFTDNQFHNTGIGYHNSMSTDKTTSKVQLAPGIFIDVDPQIINTVSEQKFNDLGRYEITQNPDDRWKYKTPSLRNISLTAPYMHNGSLATLEQVIRFYNQGGFRNQTQDPLIKPLALTEQEISQLLAFLNSLTGDNVQKLVADGLSQSIGDTLANTKQD